MRRITTFLFVLSGLLLLTACGRRQLEERIISVTIEPQRYFAEQIAGDRFLIHCVVPAGQSPETYDPTPQQMVGIGESEAYLRIGSIGFELAWMEAIQRNNPQMPVFDLSEGMPLLKGEAEEAEGEPHSSAGEHTHHHAEGEAHHHHHHGGVAKIDSTEAVVKELLRPLTHRAFIIYHPALTYFAAENGLEQLCIEMEGKEPSPAQLKALVEAAQSHQAKVVFVQQEFDQKNAELIAQETGCQLTGINPLAYDWSREIIRIAKALADGEAH